MGYFVSVLRERIANFEAPPPANLLPMRPTARQRCRRGLSIVIGVSINDLRKNLRDLNEHMDRECRVVRGALRHHARRLADHRHRPARRGGVGAGGDQHRAQPRLVRISLAQASADQKIVQSRRAVEIETLKAQAEVEPLQRAGGAAQRAEAQRPRRAGGLRAQRRASACSAKAQRVIMEVKE